MSTKRPTIPARKYSCFSRLNLLRIVISSISLIFIGCSTIIANDSSFNIKNANKLEKEGWAKVPDIIKSVKCPSFPENTVLLTDFGGKGDKHSDNRLAFSKALQALSKKGGGKLIVPPGEYFVDGPIILKDNINIEIQKNARVFFSTNTESYLPLVKQRWGGVVLYNYTPLIYGYQLKNIALTGKGTIDGTGAEWSNAWRKREHTDVDKVRQMGNDRIPENQRVFGNGFLDLNGDGKDDGYGDSKRHFLRLPLIHFYECKNVMIKNLTIKDSPFWTIHTAFCKNITIKNITVKGDAANNDGIDPDSCENVLIENCLINTSDDAIAIKAGRDQDAWDRPGTKNIVIRNNRLSSRANALCIGSEMSGGVSSVFVENNVLLKGAHALCFKCNLDRGGFVSNIYIRNIKIETANKAILIFRMDYHGYRGNHFPTHFSDFFISDITCKKVTQKPFKIIGVKDSPIQRIFLNNIKVEKAGEKSVFEYTKDIILKNVAVNGKLINTPFTNLPTEKNKKPAFIHATYFMDGLLKSKKQLEQTRFEQFDFMYVMAVPHWTAKDFEMPEKDIMNKLVYNFEYTKTNLFSDNYSPVPFIPDLIAKAHKKNVKVLLSIPGTTRFNPIVNDAKKMAVFARVMAAVIKKHNYDGIDIDWESTINIDKHTALMMELRKALNSLEKTSPKRKYYLTTALNVYLKYSKEQAQKLSRSIDWINLMTYDMGGGAWSHKATHNTPFDKIKKVLKENWLNFSKDKICIGLANYGFYYKKVIPGKKYKESLKSRSRYFFYKELPAFLKKGWKESYDEKAEVPYYFSPDKTDFITIDNKRSLTRKIEWILKKKYRGVFWWEFHLDCFPPVAGEKYAAHPLIDYITSIIRRNSKKIH